MIRLALRQFRTEAAIGFGLLIVVVILLAVTGPHLAHVNDAFQSTCKAANDCATESNPVVNVDKTLTTALQAIATVAPALIGIFFGAPLVARELEAGTFRLAWTQSVTRRRWLAAKLGVVGLASMAVGGLLTWMVDWWMSPIDAASQDRFGVANFGFHGVAPIGYAAFAFALGVTAGVLLRRTVPAMAVTVAGFAAARVAVTYWVRPNLASPVHESLPLSAGSGSSWLFGPAGVTFNPPHVNVPNGWVYSTAFGNKAGNAPTAQYVAHACPVLGQFSKHLVPSSGGPLTAGPAPAQLHACIDKLSATFHTVVTFQPASRFWPFQWGEMGVFLAAALALCAFAYWWLRRRYA